MKYINLNYYGRQTDPFYFALEKHLLNLDDDFCFLWSVYPAVIIGKHQVSALEVDRNYLDHNNIFLFRRPSGGGAVYSDEGCIKYTFISKKLSKDELYLESLTTIKNFLLTLGLHAELSGRNDLLLNGQKFSGNAYYQTDKGRVLHGTLLFDTDLEKMVNVLTPSKEKLSSKGVNSVRSRVINLSEFVNLSRNEFIYLLERFLNGKERVLTNEEHLKVLGYKKEFESNTYIYGQEPKYQSLISKRFPFGEVIVNYEVKNNQIIRIKIYGDFFVNNSVSIMESKLIGFDLANDQLSIEVSDYIENMKNEDFINLLKGKEKNE